MINTLASGTASNISINVPTINANMFMGTAELVAEQLAEAASTLIETISAPLEAAKSSLDSTVSAAETAYDAAKTAYKVACVASPKIASKLKVAMERAQNYRDNLSAAREKINRLYLRVESYIDDAKETIEKKKQHSLDWIEEKLNWCIAKVYKLVEKGTLWLQTRLKKIEQGIQKKADKAKAKVEAKIKERAQQLLEDQATKEANIKLQEASTMQVISAAPKKY